MLMTADMIRTFINNKFSLAPTGKIVLYIKNGNYGKSN